MSSLTPAGSGGIPLEVEVSTASNSPYIYNIELVDADTEYEIVLPANTTRYEFRARGSATRLRVAYVAGETNTNYWTVPQGCSEQQTNVEINSLFIQPANPVVLELVAWT